MAGTWEGQTTWPSQVTCRGNLSDHARVASDAPHPRTLGDLLAARPAFVGREWHLREIERWLSNQSAEPLLAVSGIGGIGKSALVAQAVRRFAPDAVVHDLRGPIRAEPPRPFGESTRARLWVVDEWDRSAQTRAVARRLVHQAPIDAKVLLAGREDPARTWPELEPHTRLLPLTSLGMGERVELLHTRGVRSPHLGLRMAYLLGGHPLSLRLVPRPRLHDTESLRESPDLRRAWGIASRRIMESVPPPLRPAVVAASLARILDEDLLERMLGRRDGSFHGLAELPLMHSVTAGLAIDPDARRPIAEHAAWAQPDRVLRMRSTAMEELHERFLDAPPGDDRTATAVDLHFIARDRTDAGYLAAEEDGYRLRPGRMSPDELQAQGPELLDHLMPHVSASEREHFHDLLSIPGAWVTTAVDQDQQIHALGGVAPLHRRGLSHLPADHRLRVGAEALTRHLGLRTLPETERDTNLYAYTTGLTPLDDPEAGAAMYSHIVELNLRGGAYVVFAGEHTIRVQLSPALRLGAVQLHRLPLDPRCLGEAVAALAYDRSRLGVTEELRCHLLGLSAVEPTQTDLDAAMSALVRGQGDIAVLCQVFGLAEDDPVKLRDLVRGHVDRVTREDLRVPSLGHWLRQSAATVDGAIAPTAYRVRLLGDGQVIVGSQRLSLGTGPLFGLVALVSWHRTISPEQAIAALWPDVPAAQARVRLRTSLARVRKIAPGLVVREGRALVLGRGAEVDVVVAAELAARLTRSGSSVRRDAETLLRLLESGRMLSSVSHEEWAQPIIDEFEVRMGTALAWIGEQRELTRELRQAAARQFATRCPDDETTLRRLSRALASVDDALADELERRARVALRRLGLNDGALPIAPVTPMSRRPHSLGS